MDFIVGTNRILYIKVDGLWMPIGCLTSNSFSESSDMLGTTTRDNTDGWETSVPTNQRYSIPFDGILTSDLESSVIVNYYDLKVLKRSRTRIEWKVDDGASPSEEGFGYISELGDTNTVDEFVSFSGLIVGFGSIGVVDSDLLLLETGDFVLLETGDKIIL